MRSRALTMDTKESMRALAVRKQMPVRELAIKVRMPMRELAMKMQESMRASAQEMKESMRALAKEMKKSMRASTTEAEKLMRALATETIKPMRALAPRFKPAVQQELITLTSSTEIFLDRDIQIALFYYAVKIPLLVDIGATAFREGDIDSATVSWETILLRQHNAERRAREPPEKCSAPSWQLNIAMSVPMRATSAASSVATCTEIPLHLTNPSDCMSSEGSLSRHILLMRTSASAETRESLEAAISNCPRRLLASIASGASVPSEKSIVVCVSNIPTNFWTLPSERDQLSSFPSMAANCCVDPRTQVPEGEMSKLIVTSAKEGAFGMTRSQLMIAFGINIPSVPCCEGDQRECTQSEGALGFLAIRSRMPGETAAAVLSHAVATASMAARAQAAGAASPSLPFASVSTSRSVVLTNGPRDCSGISSGNCSGSGSSSSDARVDC